MFVFDNVLTAGTVLVRQQIESQNWESSGHTAGWFIGADGNASFFTVTLHGDLVSSNYVANTSGYKLTYATGDAEVNQLTSRGTLHVGPSSGQRLDLKVTLGIPRIELWSGDASEVAPAFVATDDSNVGFPALRLDSVDVGQGVTELQVISPDPSGNNPGEIFIGGTNSTPTGIPATIVNLASATTLFSNNVHDVTLTSVNHAFQIGPTSGVNLAMDNNELVARNNNAASTLNLNTDGGDVNISGGAGNGQLVTGTLAGAHTRLGFNQLWAQNGAAQGDLFLNFSSNGDVNIGNGTAAGAQLIAFAMAASAIFAPGGATAGGLVTSLSYVSSNALGSTFTVPSSGRFLVQWGAELRGGGAPAGAQRAFCSFQIQQTNSAGAVVFGATDANAIVSGIPAGAVAGAGTAMQAGRVCAVGGMVPGSTIFIVLCNRVSGTTATSQSQNPSIQLIPLP